MRPLAPTTCSFLPSSRFLFAAGQVLSLRSAGSGRGLFPRAGAVSNFQAGPARAQQVAGSGNFQAGRSVPVDRAPSGAAAYKQTSNCLVVGAGAGAGAVARVATGRRRPGDPFEEVAQQRTRRRARGIGNWPTSKASEARPSCGSPLAAVTVGRQVLQAALARAGRRAINLSGGPAGAENGPTERASRLGELMKRNQSGGLAGSGRERAESRPPPSPLATTLMTPAEPPLH